VIPRAASARPQPGQSYTPAAPADPRNRARRTSAGNDADAELIGRETGASDSALAPLGVIKAV